MATVIRRTKEDMTVALAELDAPVELLRIVASRSTAEETGEALRVKPAS